jgi:hypothetical protein
VTLPIFTDGKLLVISKRLLIEQKISLNSDRKYYEVGLSDKYFFRNAVSAMIKTLEMIKVPGLLNNKHETCSRSGLPREIVHSLSQSACETDNGIFDTAKDPSRIQINNANCTLVDC